MEDTASASACLPYVRALVEERGGFDFSNVERNRELFTTESGKKVLATANMTQEPILHKCTKTGTTICGLVTKEGVVLGADTRATAGPIVCAKECQKLHRLANNIYTAGAGVAADLDHVMSLFESKMELERLSMRRQCRVASVVTQLSQQLFRYQGHIVCALVLGGVDCKGPALYTLSPHGYTDRKPFAAMGSGSLFALAELESNYREDLTLEEGKQLVARAIRAGIFNDLGSGSNVDVVAIKLDGTSEYLQGFDKPNPREFRSPKVPEFKHGTTAVLQEVIQQRKKLLLVTEEVQQNRAE